MNSIVAGMSAFRLALPKKSPQGGLANSRGGFWQAAPNATTKLALDLGNNAGEHRRHRTSTENTEGYRVGANGRSPLRKRHAHTHDCRGTAALYPYAPTKARAFLGKAGNHRRHRNTTENTEGRRVGASDSCHCEPRSGEAIPCLPLVSLRAF